MPSAPSARTNEQKSAHREENEVKKLSNSPATTAPSVSHRSCVLVILRLDEVEALAVLSAGVVALLRMSTILAHL